MAEMVITQLRRTGSGTAPTPVEFRWTSSTHSSMTNPLKIKLKVTTMRRMPAGAEQPVEQVMSVQWEPFPVEGEWNDKWAGAGFARAMRRDFPRAVGQTMLARLQIDQESLVGLITDVETTYITPGRSGYSFTFSPHVNEAVGSFQQSANQVPTQPLNQRIDNAFETVDDLIASADAVKDLPVKNTDIEDTSLQVQGLAAAVARAQATVLGALPSDPTRPLLASIGAFRQIRSASLDMMLSVADKRSDLTIGFDDAISILSFDEWRSATLQLSARSVGASRDAELDLSAKAAQKPRAIHYARAGENLERISLSYYGTADNWRAIFDANNLHSTLLAGGEVLIIPERTS
jgi:hypothetical protein